VTKIENKNGSRIYSESQSTGVLIVGGDCELARFILKILARKGVHGDLAADKSTAENFLEKNGYGLVFLSERISCRPGTEAEVQVSFDLLSRIRAGSPQMPVIMTEGRNGHSERLNSRVVELAVKAVQSGCCNFLTQPAEQEKVEGLLDLYLPGHNVHSCAWAAEDGHNLYTIVGRSSRILQTVNLARRMAPTSAPVLISGESGTGKELISYLIHKESNRSDGPLVRVSCAALTETLIESELFGHEKGAFTGAYAQRKGRFEMAHGGTLLLDEITETPLKFQSTLLRVLEQQNFERVGGSDNVKVDVRIISTTNKDLGQQVQQGCFRADLYYRLSGLRLVIPPLRERAEDLEELVWHFVNLYAHQAKRIINRLDPVMMDIFVNYHWPGNVRQLRNVVLTSLILGSGKTLSLADVSWLFDELEPLAQEAKNSVPESQKSLEPEADKLPRLGGVPLVKIERQAILDTLRKTSGNQTKAAKILGISDRTLREKVRKYREQDSLAAV